MYKFNRLFVLTGFVNVKNEGNEPNFVVAGEIMNACRQIPRSLFFKFESYLIRLILQKQI